MDTEDTVKKKNGKVVEELEKIEKMDRDELFEEFDANSEGLSTAEAQKRLEQYGMNALEDTKTNPILQFLSYFWGPIPWMIEVAAVLSAVLNHWVDLIVILVLLGFNGIVGFFQEHQASNAIDALKSQLALKAKVKRDGEWKEIEAKELVPGDILRIRLGDVVPADVKLLDGDYLSVDQSALTGESLPVNKKKGNVAYSGSVAKQGEMEAFVVATGSDTYFGKTAKLVSSAQSVSHFQKAVLHVGDFLIFVALGLVSFLILVELFEGASVGTLVEFALILTVASIPVAMPAVLSVTMALGAIALSKMKAIVSKLQSIEEMAGMDILCSDKTGTLTQNKITLDKPELFGTDDEDGIILAGALASKKEDQDLIDLAVIGGLKDQNVLDGYSQEKFTPFDPVSKRTEALIKDEKGNSFKVTKGAPQVILKMANPDEGLSKKVGESVDNFAKKGYRTLGVARSDDGKNWKFLGILPLMDPPREDSYDTIERAKEHGIKVKMVTGDNVAIGKEISSQLGLGTNLLVADQLFKSDSDSDSLPSGVISKVEKADGFAQVFPEHKFEIVKALQQKDHIVGMTGDGVNDAPALKEANTGIAVSGATDAARAAASLVLTAPGLSVIINAVEEARKIFERMNSYVIYRIAMTLDIMFFVVAAMVAFNFYPLTAVMIILLALLDDIPIMTIAYDNTWLDPKPVRWDMRRVISVSTVLGIFALLQSFAMLLIARNMLHMPISQVETTLFLQLVAGGHLMLFVTRTKKHFWSKPGPASPLFWAIIGTQIFAVLITGFGFLVPVIPWWVIGVVWIYNVVWMFIFDVIKIFVYRSIDHSAKHHRAFIDKLR